MQKLYLLAIVLAIGIDLHGQCHELFFSEYVEGYYNNKALELYNPTANNISLSGYRISTWHNATSSFVPWYCDTLYGSIGPNQVKVIVINKRDSTAGGLDTIVATGLRKKANIWLSPNKYASMSMNFNGDDPVILEKKVGLSWQPIDIIGKIGEQPSLAGSPNETIGWSDSFPYNQGKGTIYTKDHTLIRKSTVKKGVTINPNYFKPQDEWLLYPVNMFDSLGSHRCNCNAFAAGVKTEHFLEPLAFPNPFTVCLTILSPLEISQCFITDLHGNKLQTMIKQTDRNENFAYSIDTKELARGFYLLCLTNIQGQAFTSRLLKQ